VACQPLTIHRNIATLDQKIVIFTAASYLQLTLVYSVNQKNALYRLPEVARHCPRRIERWLAPILEGTPSRPDAAGVNHKGPGVLKGQHNEKIASGVPRWQPVTTCLEALRDKLGDWGSQFDSEVIFEANAPDPAPTRTG
jgi:hypothetical protein